MKRNIHFMDEELDILSRHNLTVKDVHDGRDETSFQRKHNAKSKGCVVVLRSPIGTRCMHRLTTRAGHCIACNPAALGFLNRCNEPGAVYVVFSGNAKIYKIGSSQNIGRRIESLNVSKYAGQSDWVRKYAVWCKSAGRVEMKAHGYLTDKLSQRRYLKDGIEQYSSETFNCTLEEAKSAIERSLNFFGIHPDENC